MYKTVYQRGRNCSEYSENQVDFAILQRRSPSCGYSVIYDGTFTGNLVTGSGVFAQMLQGLNIPIMEAESEKFV